MYMHIYLYQFIYQPSKEISYEYIKHINRIVQIKLRFKLGNTLN